MIRAILFDFDGVLTTDPSGSYSTIMSLSKRTGVNYEKVAAAYEVFRGDRSLQLGKRGYSDHWEEFVKKIGVSVDIGLLEQVFLDTPVNKPLINLVSSLRKNYKTGLLTDNSLERFTVLRKKYDMDSLFDSISVSSESGHTKGCETAFREAVLKLKVSPEEVLFVDNSQKNLDVAAGLGFKTLLFDGTTDSTSKIICALK